VITPRRTRLHRVSNLSAFQRAIRTIVDHEDVLQLRNCAVIVPTRAAADQLRRTLESWSLGRHAAGDTALSLPHVVTRDGWYDLMYARLPLMTRRASGLEREVIIGAVARQLERGARAPFRLRPGLLAAMLTLYDDLRRTNVSVERFESAVLEDLNRDVDTDRGAARLVDQTGFLAATFRGYQDRLQAAGMLDEHALRARLLDTPSHRPLRQVVVTVGDCAGDPSGLWKADFDLLARLPLLERVDIVATRAMLASGLLDRLQDQMPGYEEAPENGGDAPEDFSRAVVIGGSERPFLLSRDREDELTGIAKRIKDASRRLESALERRAVVFKRPLPYMYLAQSVFADAGIPYQAFDALPLAAEPYAAALDLVFEFVSSGFTRETVIALLSSPHFDFDVDSVSVSRAGVARLNRVLSDAGYFGGVDHLRAHAATGDAQAARAATAAADLADELRTLTGVERPSRQLGDLLAFLGRHVRMPSTEDLLTERELRARSAIHAALDDLMQAHQRLDDEPRPFTDTAAIIRRWIESQTFRPRTGSRGVQLLDAQAARYGEFDDVFLVGLVEREWPEAAARNIFYPPSLLARFGWPDARALPAAERAAFVDLAHLASRSVTFSTFELENDAIVGPSVFLEEIDRLGLAVVAATPLDSRMLASEAVGSDPVVASAIPESARDWLSLRELRSDSASPRFHGTGMPQPSTTHAISALERYLRCPFIYFCERVLKLEEDPQDEATLSSKDLGIFVHEVFEAFFQEWDRLGRRGISPADVPDARRIFREVVEPLLDKLSGGEAAVQRTRLLGSAVDPGLAEAVFQIEAEWETPVVKRLLEYPLEGEFELQSEQGPRRVRLRGKADRIDLLADGSLRIIDYKLGYAPDRRVALQLPIYGVCAVQHLRAATGRAWILGQAGYIAFGEERSFVPMLPKGKNRDEILLAAQSRLLETVDAIERGQFPPAPYDLFQCGRCAYAAVCRKDYVGDV
jgi:RecB family exonuclease